MKKAHSRAFELAWKTNICIVLQRAHCAPLTHICLFWYALYVSCRISCFFQETIDRLEIGPQSRCECKKGVRYVNVARKSDGFIVHSKESGHEEEQDYFVGT